MDNNPEATTRLSLQRSVLVRNYDMLHCAILIDYQDCVVDESGHIIVAPETDPTYGSRFRETESDDDSPRMAVRANWGSVSYSVFLGGLAGCSRLMLCLVLKEFGECKWLVSTPLSPYDRVTNHRMVD